VHRFETSYRRHLANEQRRAVLHALRDKLEPTVTMGEVIDAAEALGFGDQLGELSLQDLADALLTPVEEAANSAALAVAPDEPPAKPHKVATKSKKTLSAAPKPTKVSKAAPKSARLKALKKKIDAEERMSLDEAAEVFLPVIEEMQQATMQDLESFTGIGRRKLRFHVGQLVREGHLERHGMGRGTYYTLAE
jgi:hypothetical protein